MGLAISVHQTSPIYIHDTNTNKICIIECSRTKWTKLYTVFPQYMRIYRHQTLPPEVRQLVLEQHGPNALPETGT